MEIAYFVNGECRGHDFLNYYPDEGDSYPILEGAIYYANTNEEVTFKLFDHATGVEYEACSPNISITTGEDHVELYFNYDEAVVLNFTSPGPPEPSGSYWPEFVDFNYDDQGALVAGIMIDGEIIDLNYENWDKLEVAAFVGNECRGNNMYLTDDLVLEYGYPYPTLDACPIYYNDGDEPVSFKMYDHQNNVLYENCEVLYQGEPKEILTGEDYFEGWDDPDSPVFLFLRRTHLLSISSARRDENFFRPLDKKAKICYII